MTLLLMPAALTFDQALYEPPCPRPLSPLPALLRTVWQGEGNLLSLLPRAAYHQPMTYLGWSRRSILLVNKPSLMREVMTDPADIFPKNDLMVGALEPLVGDSIFVSSGPTWRAQRKLIDPAFSHIRLAKSFEAMDAAVSACIEQLDRAVASGAVISLDLLMSQLTADIICRTVFSTSLQTRTAQDVFDAFEVFERSVAQVGLKALIFDPPFRQQPQHPAVLEACSIIRRRLGEFVDTHIEDQTGTYSDIASHCIGARDPDTGVGFDRKQLIDQLGVLFLAGHETTASALTWLFFIASQREDVVGRIRHEVHAVCGEQGEICFEHTRQLHYIRNSFKETLRLYPPITFIPRVASESVRLGEYQVKRGAMIMISPWTTHRNSELWRNPRLFDPDRFTPERESELIEGCYLPFGTGPRTCVGAAFAQLEAVLIVGRLLGRFRFEVLAPERVRPVARLTTRPSQQILCRVHHADGDPQA